MDKLNPNEAPEGYVAVQSADGNGCKGCDFYNEGCDKKSIILCTYGGRVDGQEVTFKKIDHNDLAGMNEPSKDKNIEYYVRDGEGFKLATDEEVEQIESRHKEGSGDLATSSKDPKRDAGMKKCPMHLLPPEFLEQTAWVLGEGVDEYGDWNWRWSDGIRYSTYIGAILRHFTAIMAGEDIDPKSGLPHIAKIAANCSIVIDAIKVDKMIDDRAHTFTNKMIDDKEKDND